MSLTNEEYIEHAKDKEIDRLRVSNAMLRSENAKLREFAGQVLYFTTMTDGCGDNCPYSSSDCSHECHLREQGRELGIEVPS